MKQQDVYGEPIIKVYDDAIVKIYHPILTPEERARREEQIKQAAIGIIKAKIDAERENAG